jgi:curved DNA-binding protein CbpA
MDRDLYGVLGVPITASQAEIRHAFREVAKRRHPDVNRGDPDAPRKFMEALEAAETLLNPRRRAVYDARARRVAPPPMPEHAPMPPVTAPRMSALGVTWRTALAVCGIGAAIALLVATPRKHTEHIGSVNNGAIMWKATGFRLDDGWGINLAGQGTRLQVFPGMSTDLEVDSGYLSSAGHITFLRHGAAPTFEECLSTVRQTSDQAQSLDEIRPDRHADLCSSGASGDVAFIRVTRNDQAGMSLDITVWKNI